MKWIANAFLTSLLSILIAAGIAWGTLAIYYSNLPGEASRKILASVFAVFSVAMLGWYLWTAKSSRPLFAFLALFVVVLAWWLMIPPRQDRDWAPEYAKPAYATINGDLVTVHNIRNFDYRTETDFTSRYYDKTFDLRKLDSFDIIACYWTGYAIAHIFVSFGFGDKDFLAISVETRRERKERFSPLPVFLSSTSCSTSWRMNAM